MTGPENGAQRPADETLLAGHGERLRVLIADHDGLARRMMRTALGEMDRVAIVLTAGHSREALDLVRRYRPTVVIIDTALPPNGGVELIAKVLAIAPETPVLTVSVDDPRTAIAGLSAGAVGHIDKDTEPDELARLVVRAADGEPIVPQRLIKPLLELVRALPNTGWRPLHSRLTTREWEIVELLGESATTQQIAERLVLSPTTIYSHVRSLLRKLGVHSRQEAIAAARTLRNQETSATASTDPIRKFHQLAAPPHNTLSQTDQNGRESPRTRKNILNPVSPGSSPPPVHASNT